MLPYLPYAALLLALFFGFYKLLLEKETFFQLNRWFLIGGLILCFLLPTIEIPEHWSIRSETPLSQAKEENSFYEEVAEIANPLPTPSEVDQNTASVASEISTQAFETPTEQQSYSATTPFWKKLNWSSIAWYGYLTGLVIFLINLLIQLAILIRQIVRLPKLKDGKFYIVEMEGDKAPYSFLNYIFINPTKYDWETYQQILQHEKVHISQAHSIDMILAELTVVVQWFNPFA